MVAPLKYRSGMPCHRLERLQADLQIPLPSSTQWEIVADTAQRFRIEGIDPASRAGRDSAQRRHEHDRARSGASGRAARRSGDVSPNRTGVLISGFVATRDGHRIALFLTGRRHAGENLARVLEERTADLGPPIQM